MILQPQELTALSGCVMLLTITGTITGTLTGMLIQLLFRDVNNYRIANIGETVKQLGDVSYLSI